MSRFAGLTQIFQHDILSDWQFRLISRLIIGLLFLSDLFGFLSWLLNDGFLNIIPTWINCNSGTRSDYNIYFSLAESKFHSRLIFVIYTKYTMYKNSQFAFIITIIISKI